MHTKDYILAVLPALYTSVVAQTTTTVWGSVVFTFRGDQEPILSNTLTPSLTSLGANQVYDAGAYLRSRYLVTDNNQNATHVGIRNIALNIPINDQLTVMSTDDEATMSSSLAFVQGLYPPLGALQADDLTIMGDGTYAQYPLNGYQYVGVDTVGSLDWNYIWLAGSDQCVNYQLSTNAYSTTPQFSLLKAGSNALYGSLASSIFSPLALPSTSLTYTSAYQLWEYANYQYNHNMTARNSISNSTLSTLRLLASQQQFALNGNLTASGAKDGDMIRGVAGKTLAYRVIQYLSANIVSGGRSNKLNLMFGSYKPFLSFFALSGLSSHALSTSNSMAFQSLPLPGSTLVFELFSVTPSSQNLTATGMPNTDNLWVRFMFRNGTDNSNQLISYPLFGRGNSETDMTWSDFKSQMQGISVQGIADWCMTCGDSPLFCPLFVGNDDSSGSSSGSSSSSSSSSGTTTSTNHLAPSIAGVIGAVVTLSVVLLIILLAITIGGVRFERRERKSSFWGGFKGAEKMKSDMDVNVIKSNGENGEMPATTRHERLGSWELNESPTSPTSRSSAPPPWSRHEAESGAGIESNVISGSETKNKQRIVSTADYSSKWDDGEDDGGIFDHTLKPVVVHERI